MRAATTVRREVVYRRRFRGLHDVKINVGCGPLLAQGWVNVDVEPPPGAYYLNAVNGFKFDDGAAKHIHCEHFLEHLEYSHAVDFLTECHRVLRPGGSLRLIVPDGEKYMLAYARRDTAFFSQLEHLGNAQDRLDLPAKVVNQAFRMGGGHRYAWDFENMEAVLRQAGFSRVERSEYRDVAEEFRIDGSDEWRPIESLYVNVWKMDR
jgi:predicted SAM-dependent methyltransferase